MSKIIIVGNGGIGSNITVPLIKTLAFRRLSEKKFPPLKIVLADGDTVEIKNVYRQDFVPKDIKAKKTNASADFLNNFCHQLRAKNITVESYPFYVKDDNINIIEDKDVVFVGVDNYITRKIIEERTKALENSLVIFGGNEYHDGDINVIHKQDGKYLTPLLSDKHPEINTKDKFPDEMSCEEAAKSSPQILIVNSQVAVSMLECYWSYLETSTIPWHEKMFDIQQGNVRVIK